MSEQELQELDLEAIMREFSDAPAPEETETSPDPAEQEKTLVTSDTIRMEPVAADASAVEGVTSDTVRFESVAADDRDKPRATSDTIRMEPVTSDTIRMEAVTADTIRVPKVKLPTGVVRGAEPLNEEEDEVSLQPVEEKTFDEGWEPEYEQPMGEYVPPQPIVFHPKSRLRELKRKLIAGPEKRYYELSEKGVGKLQAAIFLSLLVVLISAGSTAMYAMGMVQENRLRLMVFGQLLAMLVSALLGSFQLIDGVTDILKKRFSLNSLLVFTFLICCVDAVFCLRQLRVPCCAAFSLEMTMSLWNTYHLRSTEMSQMDTMRKANHLDTVAAVPAYDGNRKGFLRGEGQVEDFMDTYQVPSGPEKVLGIYALICLCVSIALGIAAGVLHGVSAGIQVAAVTTLAAVPATMFITLSRPMALLQRRLHALGTVLCGWQGIKGLCGKAVFPIRHQDLFPAGTVRMNGVKFYGSRNPDEIVAYGTAVITADGGGLAPMFQQVLDSRNGRHYDASELCAYHGGIGGVVQGEVVLVGSLPFLKDMGVEVPEGIRVHQAVCVAVSGELCGLFAITYEKSKNAAAGLGTLCAYRGLAPIVVNNDFNLSDGFLKSRFGVKSHKVRFPDVASRTEMRTKELPEDSKALLLVTTEGLPAFAYGVTGARALHTASVLGTVIHMIGGILGIAMMGVLTALGALELLTPANLFLYQLVWLIPGLLITEWTRQI